MAVYVCSDIHGQRRLLMTLLEKTGFSDDDRLYVAGDIIDRGPESIPLLLKLMKMENAECILGNHEFMMWTQYRCPGRNSCWMHPSNGAGATIRQFLALTGDERKEILDFIEGMLIQKEVEAGGKTFLISHSDFIPEKADCRMKECGSYEKVFDVVWNSPWRPWEYVPEKKYGKDGRIHIIGHVPAIAIRRNPDRTRAYVNEKERIINIDMGCAWMTDSTPDRDGQSLCLMNLTQYAEGSTEEAFLYAFRKDDGGIGIRH